MSVYKLLPDVPSSTRGLLFIFKAPENLVGYIYVSTSRKQIFLLFIWLLFVMGYCLAETQLPQYNMSHYILPLS
ncbi:hypothetical protein GN956_G190 [Arapaima gigas]